MLRRNPLAALSLHRPSSSSITDAEGRRENHLLHEEDSKVEEEEDEMAHLIANRTGEVLGPHAILKEDHWPGKLLTTHSPQLPPDRRSRRPQRGHTSQGISSEVCLEAILHVACMAHPERTCEMTGWL